MLTKNIQNIKERFDFAVDKLARNEITAARGILNSIISDKSDFADAYIVRGGLHLMDYKRSGKSELLEQAMKDINTAFQLVKYDDKKSHAAISKNKALIMYFQERYSVAITYFQKALEYQPDEECIIFWHKSLLALNLVDDALVLLEKKLNTPESSPAIILHLAGLLNKLGKHHQAFEYITLCSPTTTDLKIEYYELKLSICNALGNTEEESHIHIALNELKEEKVMELVQLARHYEKKLLFSNADKYLKQALKILNHPVIYIEMTKLSMLRSEQSPQKYLIQAEVACNNYYKEKNAESYIVRAKIKILSAIVNTHFYFSKTKFYEEAKLLIDNAITLKPTVETFYQRALLHSRLNIVNAINDLRECVKLGCLSSEILNLTALIFATYAFCHKNTDNVFRIAEQLYLKIIQRDADFFPAHNNLAVLMHKKEPTRAYQNLKNLIGRTSKILKVDGVRDSKSTYFYPIALLNHNLLELMMNVNSTPQFETSKVNADYELISDTITKDIDIFNLYTGPSLTSTQLVQFWSQEIEPLLNKDEEKEVIVIEGLGCPPPH